MTKSKKHARPTLEEALAQPWCYYCEKTYSDVGALLSHQKDKHFQCPCRRRLNTAGGLKVHMAQVHKDELKEVPNALPHRKDPSIEVFTTVGIPEDILRQHQMEVEKAYHLEEYEHRIRTGNPAPGTVQPGAVKKQKIESAESLKARVAKRRAENAARKAAEAAGTPVSSVNSPLAASTPTTASPVNAYGAPPNAGPMNGAPPFTFNTGSNVFNTPPGMLPAQPPYLSNGPSYPLPPSVSPISAPPFAGRPPSLPPPPASRGQYHLPGSNSVMAHSLPQAPIGPPPGLPSPVVHTPQTDQSNGNTPSPPEAATSPSGLSLFKLCRYGLETVRALSKVAQNGNGGPSDAELQFKPVDLLTAICDGIYGSVSVSAKLSAKAADVLRGLLKLGVDSALPVDFPYPDKIASLKESTTNASAPSDAETNAKTGKKKNPEEQKLGEKSISWEEELSLLRGSGDGQSQSDQTTGPVNDTVTGVVGDGEMGSSVMEG